MAAAPGGACVSPLEPADRVVFGEYLALLEYKLSRRDELDRRIEDLALTPAYAARGN